MNERIKKIVEQTTQEFSPAFEIDKWQEKFAELIVRECADKAYKTAWDDLTHGYGQSVVPLHIHNDLLEHFGVKE
jgi:non-homologous end joining protein Ku